MSKLYIGLMSGTSIDGIDGVLVDFENEKGNILASTATDYDKETKELLHSLCSSSDDEIEKAGAARVKLATFEADTVNNLLKKARISPKDVIAVGSHGQTIRHRPEKGFSIQLDDGARLAALTSIDVICDFRSADIANGGNGAPLTQAFHQHQFSLSDRYSMVLNLGGIANLTLIDKNEGHKVLEAYDTGPANTLIDAAMRMLLNKGFDRDGETAKSGKVIPALLAKYLDAPYLKRLPPKSTGREDFSLDFIKDELLLCTQDQSFIPDFIATLTEFTVLSSVNAIRQSMYRHHVDRARLIVCGGGAYNSYMLEKFTSLLSKNNVEVIKADDLGVDSKLIEAHAFAYFAYMFVQRKPLPLQDSTGAKKNSILGCLYPSLK